MAVDLDPDLKEAYDLMAVILRHKGELELALEAFERSEQIGSEWMKEAAAKSDVLFDLGEHDRALAEIRRKANKWLYREANDRASAIMIWPWCARFYASRDAKFPFNLQDDV